MKIKITALFMVLCIIICGGCAQSKSSEKSERGKERQAAMGQSGVRSQQSSVVISDSIKLNAVRTVTGTVQSIVGNEVTLLISDQKSGENTERPARGERPFAEIAEGEKASDMPQRAEFADGERKQRREKAESAEAGVENGTDKTADTVKNTEQQNNVFLLPVGMKMGSKDYSSITAGNTIKIYFGIHPDDGSEMITAVEVMNGRR